MKDNGYKVIVADDRNIIREKIAGLLSRVDGVSMVVQVASERHLAEAVRVAKPELVVIGHRRFDDMIVNAVLQRISGHSNFIFYREDCCHDGGSGNGLLVVEMGRLFDEVRKMLFGDDHASDSRLATGRRERGNGAK